MYRFNIPNEEIHRGLNPETLMPQLYNRYIQIEYLNNDIFEATISPTALIKDWLDETVGARRYRIGVESASAYIEFDSDADRLLFLMKWAV